MLKEARALPQLWYTLYCSTSLQLPLKGLRDHIHVCITMFRIPPSMCLPRYNSSLLCMCVPCYLITHVWAARIRCYCLLGKHIRRIRSGSSPFPVRCSWVQMMAHYTSRVLMMGIDGGLQYWYHSGRLAVEAGPTDTNP